MYYRTAPAPPYRRGIGVMYVSLLHQSLQLLALWNQFIVFFPPALTWVFSRPGVSVTHRERFNKGGRIFSETEPCLLYSDSAAWFEWPVCVHLICSSFFVHLAFGLAWLEVKLKLNVLVFVWFDLSQWLSKIMTQIQFISHTRSSG